MGNALSFLDNVPKLPAEYDEYFGGGNIPERDTVPSVTFGGKTWTINYNGAKTRLVKRDEDGEETPLSVMKVVILDYAKRRGRAYYEGEYDPDKPGRPVCWSDDGKTPHASVQEPCAKKCDDCPFSVKGSKITPQGKEVKACAEHRMLVVVPANGLGNVPPLRLKISVTSDYDARSPELQAQGWYAFSNYMEMLRTRNINHSGRVVTKMKFDPAANFPKIIFSAERLLEVSELGIVGPLSQSDEAKALLGGTFSPNGAEGTKTLPAPAKRPMVDEDEEEAPKPVKKAAPAAAPIVKKAKAPLPPADDEDEDVVPKFAKPKVVAVVDDDDDAPFDAPKPVKAKAAKPAKEEAKATVPDELADVLADFDDD